MYTKILLHLLCEQVLRIWVMRIRPVVLTLGTAPQAWSLNSPVSSHWFRAESRLRHYRHLGPDHPLLRRAVLCTEECLAAYLASTTPGAPPGSLAAKDRNVPRQCSLSPGRPNWHQLRTTGLKGLLVVWGQQVNNPCKEHLKEQTTGTPLSSTDELNEAFCTCLLINFYWVNAYMYGR